MNISIYALIFIELLVVAWIDLKTKKISNRWSLLNLALGILFMTFFQSLYPWTWEVLLFPVGIIVIGFVLFLLGIMGAGDSKFMASLFLVVPVSFHLSFFEKIVLSTIVVGAILITFRILTNFQQFKSYFLSRHFLGMKELVKSHFSYAPVILLGWILLGAQIWL